MSVAPPSQWHTSRASENSTRLEMNGCYKGHRRALVSAQACPPEPFSPRKPASPPRARPGPPSRGTAAPRPPASTVLPAATPPPHLPHFLPPAVTDPHSHGAGASFSSPFLYYQDFTQDVARPFDIPPVSHAPRSLSKPSRVLSTVSEHLAAVCVCLGSAEAPTSSEPSRAWHL